MAEANARESRNTVECEVKRWNVDTDGEDDDEEDDGVNEEPVGEGEPPLVVKDGVGPANPNCVGEVGLTILVIIRKRKDDGDDNDNNVNEDPFIKNDERNIPNEEEDCLRNIFALLLSKGEKRKKVSVFCWCLLSIRFSKEKKNRFVSFLPFLLFE